MILSHFGDFDHTTLPGQWASTANALERRAFILKDLLFVIDDFAPPPDSRAAADLEQRAHRILRAAGNRAGRQRLTGEMTEYQTFDPRSLIISTGEILPSGVQSIAARYMTVPVPLHQVDKKKLSRAQAEKDLCSQAMSDYICHFLAPNLDKFSEVARRRWQELRESAQMRAHPRVAEMVAYQGVGFDLFTLFLQEKGAVPSSQAEEMRDRAWEVFMNLGQTHAKNIEGERPTLRFIHIIQELFAQKKVYVCGLDGKSPMRNKLLPLWDELGWKSPDAPGTNAEHIGWYGDDCLYLMPEATFKVVQEFLRRQGSYMSMGKNSLFKALADEGYVESNQEDETTRVKKIQGGSKRVLFLKPQAIL